MRTHRSGAWLMVIVLVAFAPSIARAENRARAKAEYKDGLLRYNLGEYETALEKFKAAYLDLPDPAFLFNIAQCQRQLGQFANASKSYRAFLRETRDISERQRAEVEKLIGDMDAAIREARMKAPPTGMEAPQEDKTTMTMPTTETPPATTTPPPTTTAPVIVATPPPRKPWYKNAAGMSLTFGGAGLAIIGAGLMGVASSDDSSSRTALTLQDQQNLHSSALTFQSAGIALIAIGSAAAVTGAIVLALGARHKREVR